MEILSLCIKVLLGRIFDVTLATMNTIFIVKDKKVKAMIFGFIDVFIWFVVVKEALNTTLTSIWIAICYALGYSLGTLLGGLLSKYFVKGTVTIQIITKNIDDKVTDKIKENNYTASIMKCHGLHDDELNYMIYAQVDSRKMKEFKKIITEADKNAFITVTESKETLNGYFGK